MLDKLAANPLLRKLYARLPFLAKPYHLILALLGAIFYGFPSRKIKVIGITGTKGKTSTTEVMAAILEAAGKKTALLSSLRIKVGNDSEKNRLGNSMPGRFAIQKFLRRAMRQGAEFAVIEVTSQGVVFSRHRFIRFAAAGITNIAPEHIESHGSFENYRAAKFSFLRYAAKQGARVFVNGENDASAYFRENLTEDKLFVYTTTLVPEVDGRVWDVLPGRFSKENVACAVAIAKSFGVSDDDVKKGLEGFEGIEGRAEFVQRQPFRVVVDYAHTPDSLEAIYSTAKEMTKGRIIAVLGAAGGGRDKWKRPAMGAVVARYADEIILTDEDPYDEDPKEILQQIVQGFFPNTVYYEILDRREAIREAIRRAAPEDSVVITGKGSEPYLHLAKGEKIDWSDRAIAEEALRTLGG